VKIIIIRNKSNKVISTKMDNGKKSNSWQQKETNSWDNLCKRRTEQEKKEALERSQKFLEKQKEKTREDIENRRTIDGTRQRRD